MTAAPVEFTYVCLSDMFLCMRTSLNLNDNLLWQAKKQAALRGITLTQLMEEALQAMVNVRKPAAPKFKLALLTKMGRVLPGVDLNDRDSLFDRMDRS